MVVVGLIGVPLEEGVATTVADVLGRDFGMTGEFAADDEADDGLLGTVEEGC